jgi:ABC-2 type transport system ATP-binding protein
VSGPALVLEGVAKRYGSFDALHPTDLTVEAGEIFALLGPNGAGKSTLIHCVTGIARQSAGTVRVFGRDTLRHWRQTRTQVGLVPQEVGFDPFFTPHECLMIQMGLMGIRPDAAWADRLLDRLSLTSHRNAYTRNLSGGMKRRLLIGKALVHRPGLVFLDEPTAGVDVDLRRDLWSLMEELRREQGTTIILTTHYLEEAERLADRIGLIQKGRLSHVADRQTLLQGEGPRRLLVHFAELPDPAARALLADHFEPVGGVSFRAEWREAGELEARLAQARAAGTVVDVEVQRTSLEDFFVRWMRGQTPGREA